MNFDLLSQYPLLISCIIEVIIFTFVCIKLKPKWKRNDILFILGLGLVLAALIELWAYKVYEEPELPSFFIFMFLPFTINVGLFIVIFRQRYRKQKAIKRTIAGVSLLLSIPLTFFIVNNYYSFFPTLYSLLGIYQSSNHLSNQEVILKFNPNDVAVQKNLESGLDSLSSPNLNGKVYSLNIPGTVSKFKARTAWVYVPYVATHEDALKLPVLVLMSGVPGVPENWIGSGVVATLDQFANAHKGITPLIFMVDNTGALSNDTECVNSPRGNVETYLSVDVPNYIKSHFNVSDNPADWGVGGLSMGGMCSIMITLRHPNVYHDFLDFGGELGPEIGSQAATVDTLFGGSETDYLHHQPWYLLQNAKYTDIGGYFGSGKQDNINVTSAQAKLYTLSKSAGIDAIEETIQGQHSFSVWAQNFKDALPWISNRLGATDCSAACP